VLFNSIEFAIFLPVVFGLYWAVPGHLFRLRNSILLAASYFFYGYWDWRFLSLIFVSSLVDYAVGIGLTQTQLGGRRRLLLLASLIVNLGLLGVFKYYNFFIDNLVDTVTFLGVHLEPSRLELILPVGISFYTFQTMSYSIDVYRRSLKPTRDVLAFFTYVSFFPQLVAGPIERASNLLPQFSARRRFDYERAVDGLRQILWGLFKKVVIADNCAGVVDATFADSGAHGGSTLLLGAVLFAFQIYGDFSGYSDIAIGTARLFDFNLMKNFAFPYFSRDIAEFWRRWHMSLTTWFRDYLYIPLGGSRGSRSQTIRNTFIVFLVSGFWHGANWTFIAWAVLHTLFFLPLLITNRNRRHLDAIASRFPGPVEVLLILRTFLLVTLAWVFFRAESVGDAFAYFQGIASPSLLSKPDLPSKFLLLEIALMVAIEWLGRHGEHGLAPKEARFPRPLRWGGYLGLASLVLFGGGGTEDFIYFQF